MHSASKTSLIFIIFLDTDFLKFNDCKALMMYQSDVFEIMNYSSQMPFVDKIYD